MTAINYNKMIEIRHETDVFVGGGGPAGALAAVAAAREGKKVFLAEGSCCFGGLGTIGMVPAYMQVSDGVNLCCAGLGKEIMDKAYAYSDGSHAYMSINKEALKRAYDDMLKEAGVEFRFMTQVIDVKTEAGRIDYAVLSGKSGIYAVKAKVYIDCTGDGDICAMAGAEFACGDANGIIMPSTLCSLWTDIDWEARNKSGIAFNSFAEQAYNEGMLPVCDMHVPGVWKISKTTGGGNIGHAYNVNGTDEASVTAAMLEQRRLLAAYQKYLNKFIPGFENARLASTAEVLGIRASRRIIGDYVLGVEDFKSRAVFDDEIGRYCYPVDIHPASPDKNAYAKFEKEYGQELRYNKGESYGITYRALLPKTLSNVYTAGRCMSTDNYMQASIRVMPGCYITGQAAGTAAALAVSANGETRRVNVNELREKLRSSGAYLPH